MTSSKSEPLAAFLGRLPRATECWVAYSGGVDSHVLLHLLATQGERPGILTGAVHVDHGIQQQSGDWSLHAREVCAELNVPFHNLQVDGKARRGESPEAEARRARYQALAEWLPRGAVLLTAQHIDDQAETLLLQLFRGAGPRGMAAMPADMTFGGGRLVRPLLSHTRAEILDYARRYRLRWVEDPTNLDTRYARNFVRQSLLPDIRRHWPGITGTLARAADLQADQAELAGALGQIDIAGCEVTGHADRLRVEPLKSLPRARLRNLLRYWIERNGQALPAFRMLERIRLEMLNAADDSNPLVHWPGTEVRRYRDELYLMLPLTPVDTSVRCDWDARRPLTLAAAGGTLSALEIPGQGLRLPADGRLQVRFRQGGEQLQPVGRRGHHPLKKLFQEWAVPDWERSRVPLIFVGDDLAAVAGLCVCEGFQVACGETGYQIGWSRLDDQFVSGRIVGRR